MNLLIVRILCIGFFAWKLSGYSDESRIFLTEMKHKSTAENIAVFITKEKSFLILDGKSKRIEKIKSPYQFFRRISFISRKRKTENIFIHSETTDIAMSFFDELTADSTIVKDIDYQVANGEFIIKITLLEYPSRILVFKITR